MAPKGKNVASGSGTKRSRKGAAIGSSSREPTNLPPQKFGKQAVIHYGKPGITVGWVACVGMDDVQLRIGGRLVTEDEMAPLVKRYPLIDSAIYMCQMGPVF
ncbi:hypothetical protein H5410_013437 [Solanum commersonii]|uniref:Uncharacterized protein n=1 Tax=Solanum commersonii TaxID=4109 RepID=A0A9J6AVD8_SOLCO|nr:hypothetical protein H5410_013437 [Solanum commersonii]